MRRRRQKGLNVSDFALWSVVFKWHHGSEGVNMYPVSERSGRWWAHDKCTLWLLLLCFKFKFLGVSEWSFKGSQPLGPVETNCDEYTQTYADWERERERANKQTKLRVLYIYIYIYETLRVINSNTDTTVWQTNIVLKIVFYMCKYCYILFIIYIIQIR